MQERLVIKNFGPIRDADLRFGRFNVLIGEQATGKSTVAKLLAVCRYFSFIQEDSEIQDFFRDGLEAWGLADSGRGGSEIEYSCEHYTFFARGAITTKVTLYGNGKRYETPFAYYTTELTPKTQTFRSLLDDLSSLKPNPITHFGWRPPISFFQERVATVLDNPFYVPTERGLQSIFSLGKSSIQNISDSLFNQFAKLDQIARVFKAETEIEPLRIVYKNDNGHGFVRKQNDEKFFSLFNAASGYQSTIPVVLTAKYYAEQKRKKTIIIEEPELNLFPTAQNELIRFLVDQTMNNGIPILMTTHSPYVLSAVNNLLGAYHAGRKSADAATGIIPKKYWLNQDEVSAYMLLPDGTCEDIFDRDEGLIKSEKIDAVSTVLNQQFDSFLNIEFWQK